jgi:hypothetical protein
MRALLPSPRAQPSAVLLTLLLAHPPLRVLKQRLKLRPLHSTAPLQAHRVPTAALCRHTCSGPPHSSFSAAG